MLPPPPASAVSPFAPPWTVGRALGWAAFGGLYLGAASLGMALINRQTLVTPVWPAAGLALAALLWAGWRQSVLPLAVISFAEAYLHSDGWLAALGAGAGNVLGPLLGAVLAERFAGGKNFGQNPPHLFRFTALGAGSSGIVSATFGTLGGLAGGEPAGVGPWTEWFVWGVSDVVGALLFTPLLLAWWRPGGGRPGSGEPAVRWLEATALALACVVGAQFAFGGWPFSPNRYPVEYLTIPLLIWAAFRFPVRGVTLALAGLGSLAIAHTLAGHGPFAAPLWLPNTEALVDLQVFLGCTTLMALGTAAVVRQQRAQAHALEGTVALRTTEIRASNDQLRTELTERRRAEEAVRESRAMLRLVIDMIPQAVWWKDRRSVYLGCNRAGARAAGLATPEDIVGRTDYDLSWPRGQTEHFRAADARVMDENRPEFHLLERQLQADGSEAWVETNKVPLHDASGSVVGVLGTFEDITARRRIEQELRAAHDKLEARVAERTAELACANEDLRREVAERARTASALRENEHRLRLALEAGQMSAWRLEPNANRFTWFHFQGETRHLPPAFPDSTDAFMEDVHPEDRARVREAIEQCRTSGQRVAVLYRYRSPQDERERWIETSGRPMCGEDGQVESLVGVSVDVSERKRAEEALRASEENYRSLFELNPQPTWVYEVGSLRFLAVNQAAVERYGYSREEFLAMTIADLRPPEDRERLRQYLVSHPGGSSKSGLWRHRKKDGRIIDVEVTSDALLFTGSPARLVVSEDVTERRRAETALRESEGQLRLALEAGRMSVWRVNAPDGQVAWRLLGPAGGDRGWSPETFPPSFQEFTRDVDPADREHVLRAVERCQTLGEPIFVQYRYLRRRDGRVRWLESRGQATPEPEGGVRSITGLTLDITGRKEQEALLLARANQQRSVAILGQCALAGLNIDALLREALGLLSDILAVDLGAVCEHRADTGEFILRVSHGFPEGWVGQCLARDEPDSGARCALRGPVVVSDVHAETRFRTSAFLRELGVVSVATVVIAGGLEDCPFGTLSVYSRRPRQFTEDDVAFLQAVANILAAAVERQRAEAAVQGARQEAERANAAKSEFLSRMSHELRTPLNAILGFSQLLECGDLPANHLESVGYILGAGRHLLGLIDEVLDIARIESGHLAISLEPVPLGEILAGTLCLLRPLAAEHDVRLPTVEAPVGNPDWVLADRQRLKQILLNLLSNAIKFNRPGGEITLAFEAVSTPEGARLRLDVCDTGVGLSEAQLARLFTPFDRLGAERTGVEGTGLGLVLSRRLAESMGGALRVVSQAGVGSTFTLELPRAEPASFSQADPFESALLPGLPPTGDLLPLPEETARTVLYIEDNLPNLQLIERIFQRRGAEGFPLRLLNATRGRHGLALARQHHPDLILLDLQLPDLAGVEVLGELQRDPTTKHIPIVVLSADATPQQVERLLNAGAAGYVVKPLELKPFLALLDKALTGQLPPGNPILSPAGTVGAKR